MFIDLIYRYSFALVLWELCSRTRVASVHKDSSSSLDKKISPYDEVRNKKIL